jgi:carbon monoxide dehydrogenase subunit G
MSIDLKGQFTVEQPLHAVYLFLSDPERFAPLLPGYKAHRRIDDRSFTLSVEIGVPQIKGIVDADVHLIATDGSSMAQYRSSARHALGRVDSDLRFTLATIGVGTRVEWDSTSTIRGGLAGIASGILVPLAKRNVAAMIDAIHGALAPVAVRPDTRSEKPSAPQSWWRRFLERLGWRRSKPQGAHGQA